jgi:hypothetical protein
MINAWRIGPPISGLRSGRSAVLRHAALEALPPPVVQQQTATTITTTGHGVAVPIGKGLKATTAELREAPGSCGGRLSAGGAHDIPPRTRFAVPDRSHPIMNVTIIRRGQIGPPPGRISTGRCVSRRFRPMGPMCASPIPAPRRCMLSLPSIQSRRSAVHSSLILTRRAASRGAFRRFPSHRSA